VNGHTLTRQLGRKPPKGAPAAGICRVSNMHVRI
jgi:hypothetical protein